MAKRLIFVAGLDTRAGDYNLDQQTDFVKKGWPDAEIISYRYFAKKAGIKQNGADINQTILDNPDSPILLFSAGCAKCLDLANFLKKNNLKLSNLYINEPFTVIPNGQGQYNITVAAVKLGVPVENVFVGTYPGVGSNLPGNTTKLGVKSPGMQAHWDSLTAAGKFLRNIYDNNAISGTTNTGTASTAGQAQDTTQAGQDSSRGQISGQSGPSIRRTGPPVKFITQINQPKLKARTIKVQIPADDRAKREIAESLGNFPIVWYNSYQIRYTDIEFLQLYTANNLPTLKLTFNDTFNTMKDKGFPLDDTKVAIYISPRSEQLKPIHMDFKITKFSVEGRTYTITGVIDASQLYVKKFKSFSGKTSYQTLKAISEEVGLGFASNIDDTNDSMIWINPGQKYADFLDTVVSNSYISDQAYLIAYIDFYYNLTYVEVEKELNRNIEQDLGIANIGIEEIVKKDKDLVEKIFLTNNRAMSTSNSYFLEHRVINNSTSIALTEGYSTKVKFYDEIQKDFLIFDLESLTSNGEDRIILKGQPQDDNFFKENIEQVYLGKLDTDNMYNNYHWSYIQNYRNLIELEKIGLEIKMKTPNFNFYRFQKVILKLANASATPAQSAFNSRLSGEWLVYDIMFRFESNVFSQIIRLVRKELDLSPDERDKESKPRKNRKDTARGTSPNPDPGTEPNFSQASGTQSGTQSGQLNQNVPPAFNEIGEDMVFAVPPPPQVDSKSSPSKFFIKSTSFVKKERKPTHIVLHYTAGWQAVDKGEGTVAFLMDHPVYKTGLSYHYIICVDGHIENLVDPKYQAQHAGSPANEVSIGISLQSLGTTFDSSGIPGANKKIDELRLSKNAWRKTIYGKNEDYAPLINFDGNPIKYRGASSCQEVSVAQIAALRSLLKFLKNRFPSLPSYSGLTREHYDLLFPTTKTGDFGLPSFRVSVPGIYSHCSIMTGKLDIGPTPRLINFLRNLRL